MLQEDRWDAVHILAPVSFHADYSIAALDAGKHCACAVPMATDLEDLNQIIAAQERSGKNYMMMETTVYSSEFRAIESLYRAGRMGELTLYHGVHIQNLDGYPPYWLGLDRKSTRLNSSHVSISYAVFCLKKKKIRL